VLPRSDQWHAQAVKPMLARSGQGPLVASQGGLSSVTDFEADRDDLLDEIHSIHTGLRENPDDDWLHIELRYALEELSELNATRIRNHLRKVLARIPRKGNT
jgi:hypothetical protein